MGRDGEGGVASFFFFPFWRERGRKEGYENGVALCGIGGFLLSMVESWDFCMFAVFTGCLALGYRRRGGRWTGEGTRGLLLGRLVSL